MTFGFPLAITIPFIYLGLRLLSSRAEVKALDIPSVTFLRKLPVSMRLRLRKPILLGLECAAIVFLTIAAARPQRTTILEQPHLARNIMLVVDTSHSMSGKDFPSQLGNTSRMEGVKTVVAEYVRSRHGDRVGLVVFGNTSYLQSPLTSDISLVEQLVQQLQPRMAGDGTAIGDGLGLALKRLREVDGRSKAIILMTDGVNTAGHVSPIKAAQIARELGIQIHTIGIGTRSIPLGQRTLGGLLRGQSGPVADFDEATLREIASLTGGVYFNATSLEGFKEVYRQIDALDTTEKQAPERPIIHELFAPWALAGLLSILVSQLLQATVFRGIP